MGNTPPYDQNLANQATAAEQCMQLGAVILKPNNTQAVGFSYAKESREELRKQFEKPFRFGR